MKIPETVIGDIQEKAYRCKTNLEHSFASLTTQKEALRKAEEEYIQEKKQLEEVCQFLHETCPDACHGTWFSELGVAQKI